MQDLQAAFEQWYGDCKQSLTEISYDDANKRTLCISEEKYINFDLVANKYFRGKNHQPATVDMLAFGSEHVLFVEFKAGKNIKVEKQRLQFKILASILLYERIVADIVNLDAKKLVNTKFVYLVVFDAKNCPSSSARTTSIQKHAQTPPRNKLLKARQLIYCLILVYLLRFYSSFHHSYYSKKT